MAPSKPKEYACVDCGTPTRRKRNPKQPKVCLECGISRASAYTASVARKEGPGYEVWLAHNIAYLKRLTGAGV